MYGILNIAYCYKYSYIYIDFLMFNKYKKRLSERTVHIIQSQSLSIELSLMHNVSRSNNNKITSNKEY